MLRLMYDIYQWVKRVSTASDRGERDGYSRNFAAGEDEDVGRWTFTSVFLVFTLSLYIVAGLGYYTKTHVWDTLTDAQKEQIAKTMVVDTQYL